ncbi:LIC12162 family transferase [Salinibacter ruber]|uniref:Transferase (TIGR04331 family) n=1 Tax=Salinibacter ruber TaxID=146919 RepID=A0A9X3A9L0_9BACT|nr:LIC12162 family protein [Salinibacter ruber]MCS4122742.1 putative transferase (TIGR04331 family) [Salinibacter ruber]
MIFLTSVDRQKTTEEGKGLGPWVDNEDIVLSESPFDRKEAHQAAQCVQGMTEERSGELAQILNDIHGLEHSERYWSIVLNQSVQRLISMSYERLAIVRHAAAQSKSGSRFLMLEEDSFRPPVSLRSTAQFVSGSDRFNWQLFSQCVESEGLTHTEVQHEFDEDTSQFTITSREKRGFQRFFDHSNFGLRSRVAHSGLRISSRLSKLRFLIGSRGRAWEIRQFPIYLEGPRFFKDVDRERRSLIGRVNWETEDRALQELLRRCLAHHLPAIFVERFGRLRREVLALIERNGVPDIILTGPMVGQAPFRTWVAECVRRGSTLFGIQHGSGYGDVPEDAREAQERRVADKFLTWGWERREKDHPLPVPRFAGTSSKPFQTNKRNGVLWVTSGQTFYGSYKYPLWLRWHQMGATGFGVDHSSRVACYQALNESIRANTTIRYKGSDPNVAATVERVFGSDNISSKGTLLEQAENAELVLVDHYPSTSFYELLNAQVPVILVDDIPDWYLDGAATDVLWDLLECGILHTTPESASALVNDIYPNVEEWWDQSERQSILKRARYHLARGAEAPMQEYAAFINQHLD